MRWDNKLREHKMNSIHTTKSSCMYSRPASNVLPYRRLYRALGNREQSREPITASKKGETTLMPKIKSTAASSNCALPQRGAFAEWTVGVWEHLHLEHFSSNGGKSAHQSSTGGGLWAQLHPDTNSTVCQISPWKQIGNEASPPCRRTPKEPIRLHMFTVSGNQSGRVVVSQVRPTGCKYTPFFFAMPARALPSSPSRAVGLAFLLKVSNSFQGNWVVFEGAEIFQGNF